MKALIVEDDFVSRLLLQEYLKQHTMAHIAVNGHEAVEAVRAAINAFEPYDLICLDIMMPGMDGHEALREIRRLEAEPVAASLRPSKIVMTSALTDSANVVRANAGQCDYFLAKPITKNRLLEELRRLRVIR